MIEIEGLVRRFGPLTAVGGISLRVAKGEVLGFLGPNGAGKSTTMKMITGFLAPTEGRISVCGHDVVEQPLQAQSCIGYLPEGAPAYPDMTPQEFLAFIATVRGLKDEAAKKAIDSAVARAGLSSVLDQRIDTLSKGFKRRVGLAQAILHDPPVLIMDEPTDGLDPNQKHAARNLIRSMAADKAIIISTHILEEVDAICTRAVIIDKGRIVADGTPGELENKAPSHKLDDVFRSLTTPDAEIKAEPGIVSFFNATMAVFRREFGGYFATPLAYVFIVIFLLSMGTFTFYFGSFFENGRAELDAFFGFHPWLYLFLIPAIAMRLWAEERKTGTIELLLTLPIPLPAAVLGKFLAAWAFAGIALLLTFPMWITVNYLGSPDNGVILASYFGSWLMAGAYLAIGSCISALTNNQVIAFVVTVVICFLWTIAGHEIVLNFFQGWAPTVLVNTISSFSFLAHFNAITQGVIDFRDLVFFGSLIALWLFATVVAIDTKRA